MLPPFVTIKNESRSPRYAPAGVPSHVCGNAHWPDCMICDLIASYNGASHTRPYVSDVHALTVGSGWPFGSLTNRLAVVPAGLDLRPWLSASAAISGGSDRRYPAGAPSILAA